MSWSLRKRGKIYYADISINRKRYRPSLGVSDKKIATIIANRIYEDLIKKAYGVRGDITLGEAMQKFINYSLKSKKSYKADLSRVKNVFGYFDKSILVKDINKSSLLDFMAFLKNEKDHTTKTVNNHLALLKAAINLVIADKEYTGKNPVCEIKMRKIKSKGECFSSNEIQNIFQYAKNIQKNATSKSQFFFYPFIYIALNSGMRAGEIFNLKWTDIKPSRILIRNPKSQQEIERIPNLPWLWEFMQKLPKDTFWVIGTDRRNPDTFRKIWLRMRRELKLSQGATIHWLRHSFASYLAMNQVPLNVIQALLRHSNVSTTEIYLHTDFEQMREAMLKIKNVYQSD